MRFPEWMTLGLAAKRSSAATRSVGSDVGLLLCSQFGAANLTECTTR